MLLLLNNLHVNQRIKNMSNFYKISFLLIVLVIPSIANQAEDQGVTNKWISEDSKSSFKKDFLQREASTVKHIVIATLETAPFMMKRQIVNKNTTNIEWYGYCMDLFSEIIKHLPYKVTYEIFQVDDNRYGSKSKQIVAESNKTGWRQSHRKIERWNGLIGNLEQGKAHLALAPLAVMAERELVVDFTVPFYDLVGIQILLKKPEVPQDWFKFLTVLDGEVWLSITIAYFITSFVIFLFDRLSPYSHKNVTRIGRLRRGRKNHLELSDASMWKVGEKDDTLFSAQNTTNFNGDDNQPHKFPVSSDHLGRSHELFVGSLSNTTSETQRKSTLLATGFDFNGKKKASVYPLGLEASRLGGWQQRGSRGSKLNR